jgi:hypothetical protein
MTASGHTETILIYETQPLWLQQRKGPAGAIEFLRYAAGRSEQQWEAPCFWHVAEALSRIAALASDRR